MLRNAVVSVLWVVFGMSALVALMSLPSLPWEGVEPSPGGPAVALLVSSLAGLSALGAQRGWEEQRQEERAVELRRRRMEEYTEVIESVISSFTPGGSGSIVRQRAVLGLWGSRAFLEKYAEWNAFVTRVGASGAIPLTEKPAAHRIVSELVAEARRDLDLLNDAETSALGAMIFNDYVREPPA